MANELAADLARVRLAVMKAVEGGRLWPHAPWPREKACGLIYGDFLIGFSNRPDVGVEQRREGGHPAGVLVRIDVARDWLQTVAAWGIEVVGGHLVLAATEASRERTPDGCDASYFARVGLIGARLAHANDASVFMVQVCTGYVVRHGGLHAFHADPDVALEGILKVWENALDPPPAAVAKASHRAVSAATTARTAP